MLPDIATNVIANIVFWLGLGVVVAAVARVAQRRFRSFFGLQRNQQACRTWCAAWSTRSTWGVNWRSLHRESGDRPFALCLGFPDPGYEYDYHPPRRLPALRGQGHRIVRFCYRTEARGGTIAEASIDGALGGTAMITSAYLTAVVAQTNTLADWVDGQDAAAPVPTCPKWTLADLVDHVGATQRMVAMLVGERMTEPSRAFAGYLPAPADSAQWRAWLTEGAAEASRAFENAADDTPVWDPSGDAAGVPFWSRRLFGEICVHRADAASALGKEYELEPEHAVEATEDWLATMTSRGYWENKPDFAAAMSGSGQTLHFHTTDAPGDWVARRESDRVVLEHTHAEADAVLRGPATELLLALSRRRPLSACPALEVQGDRALVDHWIDHMDWTTEG